MNLDVGIRNSANFIKEVNDMRIKGSRLFVKNKYEVFLTSSKEIPSLLHEIGRLREVTYREVGEGTNKEVDLDKYDNYYHHLILWDFVNEKIIGAHRIGLGSFIFENYGVEGFYSFSLFKVDSKLNFVLKRCIEVGRAFIIKEYQKKSLPLLLLWKGIIHITLKHPRYKYLIGCVSISDQFSSISKCLMIEFIKKYHYNKNIANYIYPTKEINIIPLSEDNEKLFLKNIGSDINKLDKCIIHIEKGASRLPILVRKLLNQKAKIVGFNVDLKFSNAIDGLIFLKVKDISQKYK